MSTIEANTELRTGSPPAPGDLYLLEGFLNTWSGELGIEDLGTAKATQEWLSSVGLWSGAKKLTSQQHQGIVKFRSDLRAWILDRNVCEPLNESVSKISFQAAFLLEGNVRFQPIGDACQILKGTLTKVISDSQNNGTWERFKCCGLSTCGWAFYDSTRSRTKRWCSMETCGSRHKAREYYKRKR